MKLACIVRVYNELKTGHAQRFFTHWQEWGADSLLVLDDRSDDGTADYARKFTPHVWVREKHLGRTKEMDATVFLINKATEFGAENILFMDCDEVLTRGAGASIREKWLPIMAQNNFSSFVFTTYSLWRTPRYRRWDQMWDCESRFPRIWKNEGLSFGQSPENQLHIQAPPQVWRYWFPIPDEEVAILHYSYASLDNIRRRFIELSEIDGKNIGIYARIVDEEHLTLEWIPDKRYPLDLIPKPGDEDYPRTMIEDWYVLGKAIGEACWRDRPIKEDHHWDSCGVETNLVREKKIFDRKGRHFIFL